MPYPAPPPVLTPPPIVRTVEVSAIAAPHLTQAETDQPSEYSSTASDLETPARRSTALESLPERPRAAIAEPTPDTPDPDQLAGADESVAETTETVVPILSAPWLDAQATEADQPTIAPLPSTEDSPTGSPSPGEADFPAQDEVPATTPAAPDSAEESATDSTEATEPPPVFPRGASPQPFWHNGAIVEGGILLTPSLPTNRPPVVLDLTADYQEFEPTTQVVSARGNVVLRLGNGVLSSDRLWVNLENRFVRVEGNVVFRRGAQTIEAETGEYNLLQGQGSLFQARGTLFLPGVEADFGDLTATGVATPVTNLPDLLRRDPITNVQGTGSVTFGTGISGSSGTSPPTTEAGGFVRRIRFEAAQVDFDTQGWYAQEVRLTNDPFSPPELEFRGNTARLTRINELQDELFVENPRLVFDQSFSVPLFRSSVLLNRGGQEEVNPLFFSLGYDGEDRDGLFVERSFRIATAAPWALILTPQFLVQRFVNTRNDDFLSSLGLEADLAGRLGPITSVNANASFSGLDFDNLEERLRASVRVQRAVGTHSLNLEYSFRDRLFNGSLGFQDVQSSLSVVFLSPNMPLGNTGVILTYQASGQYVTADTDHLDLLEPERDNNRVSLGRFQGSAAVSRGFPLWTGTPLPATPDAGLRFTGRPVVPYIQLFAGVRGTYTYYTSSDTQESLTATAGIAGELGHFSKDFLDSTAFNLSYQRSVVGDNLSPFLFDRNADQNVISGGIIQQIYGPFRFGFQVSYNLDTGENINTDLVLEYNRRTYNVVLRFNPTQSAGFIGFRLNEFDWSGRAASFGGANIRQVEGGVVR